ncbi:hypothetical protein D3C80_1575050 [compost metagenome]
MHATTNILHDAVHFLGAMTHANGKHEKGHQDRIRVKLIPQQRQQSKLPDNRHYRAKHDQKCAAHAAGVAIEHYCRDSDGGGKEQHDLPQPINQVPHLLCESGDVNVDSVTLILSAKRFQLSRQFGVIEGLTIRRA